MQRIAPVNFDAPSARAAPALIGAVLPVNGVGGRMIETGAHDEDDPALPGHGGPCARTATLLGPLGHADVVRLYGMHWCRNFVCSEVGHGAAVSIRALEPTHGLDAMQERRGLVDERPLWSGPARTRQALGMTGAHDGLPLHCPPFELRPPPVAREMAVGVCIGTSTAHGTAWRFGLSRSRFVGRRFA